MAPTTHDPAQELINATRAARDMAQALCDQTREHLGRLKRLKHPGPARDTEIKSLNAAVFQLDHYVFALKHALREAQEAADNIDSAAKWGK